MTRFRKGDFMLLATALEVILVAIYTDAFIFSNVPCTEK